MPNPNPPPEPRPAAPLRPNVDITLRDACRDLYPDAVEWRQCIVESESLPGGEITSGAAIDEIARLDRFMLACAALSLDKQE